MEKFSLPRRTGLKTKLEKEFDLLYQEIGLALLKRSHVCGNECAELRNLVQTLQSKINQLEAEKNDAKRKNDFFVEQLDTLEKSCETQKNVVKELQESYNEQESRYKEELRRIEKDHSYLQEQNEKVEVNLSKAKSELKLAKNNEEKLLRNLQDLEIKLKYREEELKKKFPEDTEVEEYSQNMADNFLKEAAQSYDQSKCEMMTKIQEVEINFFKTEKPTSIFGK